jgi:hypothetical protein
MDVYASIKKNYFYPIDDLSFRLILFERESKLDRQADRQTDTRAVKTGRQTDRITKERKTDTQVSIQTERQKDG